MRKFPSARQAQKEEEREAAKMLKRAQRSFVGWAKHVGADTYMLTTEDQLPKHSNVQSSRASGTSLSQEENETVRQHRQQQVATASATSDTEALPDGSLAPDDDRADPDDFGDIPIDDHSCLVALNQEAPGSEDPVSTYRFAIAQAMCEAGADMPPPLHISPRCDIDTVAYALPEMDWIKGQLNFHKFIICGIANVAKNSTESIAVAYCSCCESGVQAWRAIELHHHESHLLNVWEHLSSVSSTCLHALTLLDMGQAADGGLQGLIREALSCRPGFCYFHPT